MPDLREKGPAGLNLLTATELSEKLELRQTTSVAIVQDCLSRIASRDPDIRGWAYLDPEAALSQARACDAQPRRSRLHGIPIGIKDIFDTYDMPTAYGSTIYKDFRPTMDTAAVGLMRRAGMVILEELDHAQKRGAQIFGEILGYGSTADAYRITDIHPEGRGAIACMRMALKDAQLPSSAIDYVNAHGTSTTVNDKVVSLACKEVFGERAYQTPVSSTKSMMGHLIAAAGATELIVCLMAIRDRVLPPTINYENPDPLCDLDYVPNVAREAKCDIALNNSFGFGGQNITVIAGRFKG